MEKILGVILTVFASFQCKCSKINTFSDILEKVKTYCFAKSYILRLNLFEIPKKRIKLKPPNVYTRYKSASP